MTSQASFGYPLLMIMSTDHSVRDVALRPTQGDCPQRGT